MNLKVKEVCDGWSVNQNTYLDITDKNVFRLEIYIEIHLGNQKILMKFKFLSQSNY